MIKKLYYWLLDYRQAILWQLSGALRHPGSDELPYLSTAGAKSPVVIIPGVYERWTFMRPVITALQAAGHPVHVLDTLGYNAGQIPAAADQVAEYIEHHHLHEVIIVAHSKGGLIGKYVLFQPASLGRVKRLIAIAAPFSGSVYAQFFPLRSVRDFAPTAAVVGHLKTQAIANARIVSIYGEFDPHIPGGSCLDGATNIKLPVMGHFRILGDPQVIRAVLEAAQ